MNGLEDKVYMHICTFGPANSRSSWDIQEFMYKYNGEFIHIDDIQESLANLERQKLIQRIPLGYAQHEWQSVPRFNGNR